MTWRRVVARDLCCWDHGPQPPLAAGEVAVDPTRGRVRFPAGEGPTGTLTADFRFARTGAIGAAPAFRGPGTTPTRTVALEGRADFRRIQDAIDATIGQVDRVVIEILDSGTYAEALVVSGAYPGGLELRATRTARAALATIPCVLATGGPALHVQPGASVGGTGLVLEGLVLAGGDVRIEGTLAALEVRACTLAHDTVTVAIAPAAALPAATLAGVLAGRVTATARVTTLAVRDAVLHHPAVTIERPELVVALAAVGRVTLDRVTVLGALAAQTLDASDALLLGPPQPVDGDASCARFSRLPALGALRSYRCTTAMPVFVSLRPADAGYAHLHPNTHGALRRGGEEGGEIGAFHAAGVPWREQSLAHRVDEFLPAGLRAVPVRALPPVRFAGVITP